MMKSMGIYHRSFFRFLTFTLPILCFFLSWGWFATSTTAQPLTPPQTSALLAADVLRSRGYSHFASILLYLSAAANISGTIFAPPDFAFSFATAKFLNNRRAPPRPSTTLLLFHTLKPPLILNWDNLSSRPDGDELRTFYNNNCLFLFKSVNGEITISSTSSSLKVNPISSVKVRQPDLYVDDSLIVHGVDGVLDPASATKCFSLDRTVEISPPQVNRKLLDHAIRAIRRRGFSVVATAMAIRAPELLSLTSVTVFAVSDKSLFLKPGAFRYDFRRHVLPKRHRLADLVKLTAGGTEFDTLAPNKTVFVDTINGAVSVDGILLDGSELYHNRWIVVIPATTSLDDVIESPTNPPIPGEFIQSPAPFSVYSTSDYDGSIPAPAPSNSGEAGSPGPSLSPATFSYNSTETDFIGTPSRAPDVVEAPAVAPVGDSFGSPEPPHDDVSDPNCNLDDIVSLGAEGGDLFCPVSTVRKLRQALGLTGAGVEQSEPSVAYGQKSEDLAPSAPSISLTESDENINGAEAEKGKIAETVNVADDLFYYT